MGSKVCRRWGQIGGEPGRFAYFDTQAHPGTVFEIPTEQGAFLELIRRVAADWDGSEAVPTMR